MSRMSLLISTMVVVVLVSPLQAQTRRGVNLAAMQTWDIVVAEDAIPSEKYAAEEFQELFRQASSLKLQIVRKIDRPDRHIFIGPSLAMRSSNVGFGIEDFRDEDLRIIVRGGNIAIAGGRPRGTLYGVYTFLEDYLGVRFLTHDHTHVPKVGDSRIVGPVDRSYRPPLDYRNASYGENLAFPKIAARLRNNASTDDPKFGGRTPIININHSFYRQVPGSWGSQPCLSDPKVLDMVIKAVKKELETRPDAKNVQVAQNDGSDNYCRCEKCAAIDEREESHMGSLLTFVNAVADEIARTHPNVKIGTLAYNYSQKPPKTVRPRPNVQIQLCSVRCRPTRPINDPTCAQNEGFRRALAGWSRICNDIGIWNYNLNHHHYLIPNPNMRVVEPNIRFFVANHVRRVFMQSPHGTSTEFSDLKNYVTSRLLWNPNLSGRQLRNEFLRLHYGKAAGPIGDYLTLLHNKAQAVTKSYMHFAGRTDNFGIDDEVIQAGLTAFETAWELVGDDPVLRARVEKASIAVHCAAASQAMYWGEDHGYSARPGKGPKPTEKIPAELARRTRRSTRRLFELCDKYSVNWWGGGGDVNKIPSMRAHFKRIYGLKSDEPL